MVKSINIEERFKSFLMDQKKLKKQLQEFNKRYQLITENANDFIAILDNNLKYEYINEEFHRKYLGYSKDQLIGLEAYSFVHPDDTKHAINTYKSISEMGEGKIELRVRHNGSYYIWLEVKGKRFIDVNGQLKLLLISRDITERKIAEQKLKESEEKFRTIAEHSYLGIMIFQNGQFKYVNQALSKINGYSYEEMLKWSMKDLVKLIHPEDLTVLLDKVKKGFIESDESNLRNVYRIITKNGNIKWNASFGNQITFEGEPALLVSILDVTENVEMEMKLKESEERYRLISENANDLIRVLNEKFEFEYINEDVHKRILGYTLEDLKGKTHLPFLHPEDRRHAISSTVRNLKKGEGSYQARFKDKNGDYKWFEFAGTYFYDSKGKKKILSIARNINARKIAELRLRDSEEKYRKAYNRAKFYKDLFTHDMNNILAIITSSSQLIPFYLTESKKSDDIRNLTTIVQNQVERGAKLIKNVITLSELEEEEIQTQPTDACDLLHKSIKFVKEIHSGGFIKINVDCPNNYIVLNANELLQDVFDNILINAIKYNEKKNIEILINISKTKLDGKEFCKFEFADNGIGVSDDRKEIIFKRGNRELKGTKGMGIGLSLVKKIIKSYGGNIIVEDRVNGDYSKGSNFILLIPETNTK
ncbi:MAG: PAS domain S-box protein [Promethearchaeota archaeon]